MQWILDKLPLLIFLVVIVTQILRAVGKARETATEHKREQAGSDEERRVREIQEQVRRRIAQRRGEAVEPPPLAPEPAELPPVVPAPAREAPPEPRPQTTQMPEPFGGQLRRVFQEIERRVQPPPPPLPDPAVARREALGRQEELTEQLRQLEESRVLVKRRAASIAAAQVVEAGSERAQRSRAREAVLKDLRDPEALRRAFVLREVLGPPVGLR